MERACVDDPELWREVESLLSSAAGAQSFMETPAFSLRVDADETPELPRPAEESEPEVRSAGRRIGPYRIERLLGRGGMGAVYLAMRVDEFEKRVAIKVLKRDMSTGEVVRRFRHERQILAELEHPNIAQLLDGGTTEAGLPYIVMEYVEGEPIDSYCDRHRLGVRRRLELFRKVCSAVHLAHQHLIVHRDIKPGNIVVGADGEPKLLDFGIAKPLDTHGSSAPVLTASGIRPMTLKYASPEQVGGDAITTASDVYSLGVVLYELLTWSWPYPTSGDKWLDLANAIQQQPARRPSFAVDLTTPEIPAAGAAETRAPAARHRRRAADRRRLGRRLRGDLDSIVLTTLAKRPERRYPSVEQLSADVGRHLAGLPVTAHKLTSAYWAGKFVRRHKLETAMAAIVLAAILGFSVVAIHLRNEAVQERERAEEVSDFLVELFKAPGPDAAKGQEVTAREILDRGKQKIQEVRGRQPRLHARLASTMGLVYYNLGHYEDARQLLADARLDLRRHLGGKADLQLATLGNDLAATLMAQEELAQAETLFRESLAIKQRLYGEDAAEVLDTLNNLATLAARRGDVDAAEDLYRQSLKIRLTQDPPVPRDIATSHSHLGLLLLDKGDYQDAEAHYREALAIRRQLFGSRHTKVAIVLNNLGMTLQARGKIAESEAVYREALEIRLTRLGERHHRVAATQTNLASLLVSIGRFEEAERWALEAFETLRETMPGHWRTAHAQSVLGSCLAGAGRFAEAEALLLESYPVLAAAKRECTRHTAAAVRRLIDLYDRWERTHETETYRARLKKCTTAA